MKIKEYIKQIIDTNNTEDINCLIDTIYDIMEDLKEYDIKEYDKAKMKLYTLANGKVLNEEMAEKIINDMLPYHMHWTLEDTRKVQSEYGLTSIRDIDFWVVMNSSYNDYYELFNDDIEKYVRYSRLFIEDKDASKDKIFIYYTKIPKKY